MGCHGSWCSGPSCRTWPVARSNTAWPSRSPCSIEAWVERLHLAADQTVRCTSCAGTFFVSAAACPFCAVPRPTPILVRLRRWEPGRGVVAEMGVCAQLPLLEETLTLTRRHCHAEIGVNARRPVIALERRPRGVQVRALDGPCWVTPPGKSPTGRCSGGWFPGPDYSCWGTHRQLGRALSAHQHRPPRSPHQRWSAVRLDEINVGNSDTLDLRPLADQFDPLPEHRTEVLLQRAADDDKRKLGSSGGETYIQWRRQTQNSKRSSPKS